MPGVGFWSLFFSREMMIWVSSERRVEISSGVVLGGVGSVEGGSGVDMIVEYGVYKGVWGKEKPWVDDVFAYLANEGDAGVIGGYISLLDVWSGVRSRCS